ncbi:MFS transporter [Nonomuraea longicatena]|uniref:MFS transporter n=2 Tax=Nonomuraea longicatena TaxID=83682 RepID=A0ABP4ALG7_9ACTN
MFVIAGVLPAISRDLGVSAAVAGQLVTVFALAYAVLSPLLAAVTARVPRKRLMLVALVLFVIGNVLTVLAPTYPLLLATRVVAAAGAALFTPTASAVAAELAEPERRGRALALVMGGLSMASALGVPLGTWLGGEYGWRVTIWLVVGLAVVGGAGVLAQVPEIRIQSSARLRDRFTPLADRGVLAVLTTQLLVFGGGFTAYTYIASLLDLPLAAVLWAWGIGGIVGNQVSGRLTDRYGPRRMVFIGIVVATAFIGLIPVANLALPIALVWAFLWGMVGWLIAPAQQYRMLAALPGNVPVGLGLLSSAQYAGMFVAALGGGVALEQYGRAGVIGLAVALGAVGVVFTLVTYRPQAVSLPEPESSLGSRTG